MTYTIYTILLILTAIFSICIFKNKLSEQHKNKKINNKHNYLGLYIMVIISLCMVISIIAYPKDSIESAKNGLYTWFNVVLPALLPFFIVSEILVGLGVVDFIGALLHPIMKPLFNVPGEGAFPLAMSITSGYPVGVKLVSRLRNEKKVTQTQAQRLVAFCSTSGPLFMIGVTSVGMFGNVSIGPLIAISHYLAAISVGFIFRFYKRKERVIVKKEKNNYFKKAINQLIKARQKDSRPIGILMGDAVRDGMNTMLIVGGFIILYSVIIRILEVTNVIDFISSIICTKILFGTNKELINATLSGVIEMTNGCKNVADVQSVQLATKIAVVSLLIGWSGFSIHSQSMTMLSKTDINTKLYVLAKAFHGLFAFVYSFVLYKLAFKNYITTSSPILGSGKRYIFTPTWTAVFNFSLRMCLIITITILLVGVVFSFIYKPKR